MAIPATKGKIVTDIFEVTAEQSPFVMMPVWMLPASPNAVKLYAILMHYANRKTREAWPSRERLSTDMGFKQAKTLDPIIRELEASGAMRVSRTRAGGRNAPNVYHMAVSAPFKVEAPASAPEGIGPENGLLSEGPGIGRFEEKNRSVQRQRIDPENGPELEPLNYNQELDCETPTLPGAELAAIAAGGSEIELASQITAVAQRTYEGIQKSIPYNGIRKMTTWATEQGYTPAEAEQAYVQLWKAGRAITQQTVAQSLQGIIRRGRPPTRSTTDDRVATGLALAEKYRQMEEQGATP